MSAADRLALVDQLMARYNECDADGYAELMTADAVEALYRGEILRDGREGIRSGLRAMFTEFPQNQAAVKARYAVGDLIVLHEEVRRSPGHASFEVISIYSFLDGKVDRVEFIR